MGQAADGMALSKIEQALKGSDEYKAKGKSKVPGFAAGGDHAGGWRIVGEDGPELEATGPARIFNAGQTQDLMRRLSDPGQGNDALAAEIRLLRAQVELLQGGVGRAAAAAESTARSAEQFAGQFDDVTDGGNAMRADVINVVQTRGAA